MTAPGDLIDGGADGTPKRFPIGSPGQFLSVSPSGQLLWGGGPITTEGDLITAARSGTPARIPIGSSGQVLTVSGGVPHWGDATGFANPMIGPGDMITGGAGGATERLGIGSPGQILTVVHGAPAWQNAPSGLANPMTSPGDLIVGGTGGSADRLAIGGTNGQCLQVVNGAVAWATLNGVPLGGPSGAHPTMLLQPDGSIVVIPLSTYGLSGDDSTWINAAFTYLPKIAGGASSYGGSYNGPWIIGTVRLLPADYQITSGIVTPVNSGATINITGHGPGTRLFVGPGATGLTSHVAMGGPQAGCPAQQTMGRYEGLRFDGSKGGACGVEVGGGWGRHIDVACVNFNTGAATLGFHMCNAANSVSGEWTEKSRISVDLMQNTVAAIIENSSANVSASNSMEYNDIDLYIIATDSAVYPSKGLILQGGAFLSGGSLRIRGNFPDNSGPVLTLQRGPAGTDLTGDNSGISHEFIDITVESGATIKPPQTIFFGTGGYIHDCTGIMTFQFADWVSSNATSGQLSFGGVIDENNSTQALQAANKNARPAGWL